MVQDWARPVVHWEIEARDPERQRAFYADLFNWKIGEGFIMEIPAGIGGPEPGPSGHIRGGERSCAGGSPVGWARAPSGYGGPGQGTIRR